MSEPFIAEVKIFAGNFAPRGWAFCNGELLPIAQNTALFSLVGTTYGGDGRTTLGLPNLQGRAPMHPGNGPGLTSRRLGERGGAGTVTLTESEMPNHNHILSARTESGADGNPISSATSGTPDENSVLAENLGARDYGSARDLGDMATQGLTNTGGSQAHNNMQPFLALNFIIALTGLFPSRG